MLAAGGIFHSRSVVWESSFPQATSVDAGCQEAVDQPGSCCWMTSWEEGKRVAFTPITKDTPIPATQLATVKETVEQNHSLGQHPKQVSGMALAHEQPSQMPTADRAVDRRNFFPQ